MLVIHVSDQKRDQQLLLTNYNIIYNSFNDISVFIYTSSQTAYHLPSILYIGERSQWTDRKRFSTDSKSLVNSSCTVVIRAASRSASSESCCRCTLNPFMLSSCFDALDSLIARCSCTRSFSANTSFCKSSTWNVKFVESKHTSIRQHIVLRYYITEDEVVFHDLLTVSLYVSNVSRSLNSFVHIFHPYYIVSTRISVSKYTTVSFWLSIYLHFILIISKYKYKIYLYNQSCGICSDSFSSNKNMKSPIPMNR